MCLGEELWARLVKGVRVSNEIVKLGLGREVTIGKCENKGGRVVHMSKIERVTSIGGWR